VGVVGGQHLAQGHQAGVERALQMGEARLKESASPADQQHALRILGNIGAPQQLGLIKPYLNAAEPSTKREAIRALRAVESVEAYGILLDILKNDNSDVMRHAAIESLSSKAQSAEIYEYLKNQLFVEKDERVIQRIVSHLVNMRGTYPEVRKILEQYLEQCGKTSVCGFASSALASM
jgi:HEAT repeat protein